MNKQSIIVDMFFLLIVLGTLFFLFLGMRPLFTPDEGRYAEIAREMVQRNDYITPYLNGIKYFEKPPLFYWLSSLPIRLFGENLWSLRSINALLSLFGCCFTYVIARQCYDRLTGLFAALILGTSLLFFVMTQMISLDLPVTVFLSVTLYAFLLSSLTPPPTQHYYFYVAACFAGLAVLTKGFIGIVFPIFIIGGWILFTKKWYVLKLRPIFYSVIIFLMITLPWHLLISLKHPEFAYFYFIVQQFFRYSMLNIGHYQPVWFFIPCVLIGFFPWCVFLPQTIYFTYKEKQATNLFLLWWAFFIFIFFSFSKSKLIPYILPVIPPLSILTAHYLRESLKNSKKEGIKIGCFFLLLLACLIVFIFHRYVDNLPFTYPHFAKYYLSLASHCLLMGSLLAVIMIYVRRIAILALVTILITHFLLLLLILSAFFFIDTRTIKPLADRLKNRLKPLDKVVTYNRYYQDLPFYLQRTVYILNWRNELTFGMLHQSHHEWMINDQVFWHYWHNQRQYCTYVIIDKTDYKKMKENYSNIQIYPISDTLQNMLISNCPT